jgi:hypothetical protein
MTVETFDTTEALIAKDFDAEPVDDATEIFD